MSREAEGPRSSSPPEGVTFDLPLHGALGLQYLALSPSLCLATFPVGDMAKQISGQLHGGVSALVAESAASVGASVASGGQLVVGLDVTCSHLRGCPLGSNVLVAARPLRAGRLVQVWEVRLYNTSLLGKEHPPASPDSSSSSSSSSNNANSRSASSSEATPGRSSGAGAGGAVLRLPGGVEVPEHLDQASASLLRRAEAEERTLVAVARVTCLVRATPATSEGIQSASQAAKQRVQARL